MASIPPASRGTRKAQPSPQRLLLVEDDEDTRELMALALAAAGFDVQHAALGREALRRLRDGRFDLVVTDYDMPGMTGVEMLEAAAEERLLQHTPALIITAHPDPKGVEGFHVIRKPLDLVRLVALLRSLADRQPEPGTPSSH